jgi:very-long-chain enoyl-CoA reductase
MALAHYVKRELETVFVHRFSNETMPLKNIFKNSAGYWLLFGMFTMIPLLHPSNSAMHTRKHKDTVFFLLFTLCELLNLKCHLVLKGLRRPGTTERGIPKGFGFNQVSCANYWWEFCSWVAFAGLSEQYGAYAFAAASFYQMYEWAVKKHKRY